MTDLVFYPRSSSVTNSSSLVTYFGILALNVKYPSFKRVFCTPTGTKKYYISKVTEIVSAIIPEDTSKGL